MRLTDGMTLRSGCSGAWSPVYVLRLRGLAFSPSVFFPDLIVLVVGIEKKNLLCPDLLTLSSD